MYEALTKAGADADLIAIEGADHADLHFFPERSLEKSSQIFLKKSST